jgi:hypothetical protein
MKKLIVAFIVCCLSVFLWNCEKDDICDENTPTTPRLIVEFFDISNPTIPKNVTNLRVTGEGAEDPLRVFNAVNKIELPLKTLDTSTKYSFKINSTNADADNVDYLQFKYTTSDVYVSRACGYKTLFVLDQNIPYVQTDTIPNDNLWMQNITITQPNIESENETHVKVYF